MGSDHFPINIHIDITPLFKRRFIQGFKLSDDQSKVLAKLLNNVFLSEVLDNSNDPQLDYILFTNIIYSQLALVLNRPVQKSNAYIFRSTNKAYSPSIWWNSTCDMAIADRKAALAAYKSHSNMNNLVCYRMALTNSRKILCKEKATSWKKLCSSFTSYCGGLEAC